MQEIETDIIIIGAGAAGLMAAHFCAAGEKEILLLDHNKEIGRKILISGGGKCNFTNKYGEATDYYCENPHFVKSALSRYTGWDFLDLIEKHNVPYEERKWGQLFCKRSAKDINTMLLGLIQKKNITLKLDQKNLDVEKTGDGFRVFNEKSSYLCDKLVIATGGLVLPSIGASSFGHIIAKRYGHKIIPTSPALVPFMIPGFSELRGNAFVAGITCNGHYVAENVLFTHKGLSGPGILKTSLFWNHGDEIVVDWLPGKSLEAIFDSYPGGTQVDKPLKKILPNNFVDHFFDRIGVDKSLYIANLTTKIKDKIISEIHSMKIIPTGTEGFRKAEVTRGGVDTKKISSKTMESQLRKGLYFSGEVMDVTGQLGGHNFQWCWASAHAIGQAIG
jgi:predicted Rossmann fold flavoprotein